MTKINDIEYIFVYFSAALQLCTDTNIYLLFVRIFLDSSRMIQRNYVTRLIAKKFLFTCFSAFYSDFEQSNAMLHNNM